MGNQPACSLRALGASFTDKGRVWNRMHLWLPILVIQHQLLPMEPPVLKGSCRTDRHRDKRNIREGTLQGRIWAHCPNKLSPCHTFPSVHLLSTPCRADSDTALPQPMGCSCLLSAVPAHPNLSGESQGRYLALPSAPEMTPYTVLLSEDRICGLPL